SGLRFFDKNDTIDPITSNSLSKNAPLEGGNAAPITPYETAVLTGTVMLADFKAASRFCIAPYTNVARGPGMTSLPAVMYLNFTAGKCGTTLLATHDVAAFLSDASCWRSSFLTPRTTSMLEPSRALNTSGLGSKIRALVMFLDFNRPMIASGAGAWKVVT
ncbi:hypothetical protein FCV25MIE_02405, partial [Fagus crenata]